MSLMLRVIQLGERDSLTPSGPCFTGRAVLHQVSQGLLVAAVTAGETQGGQVNTADPGIRRLRRGDGGGMTAIGDGTCFM
jgi:hypothetical protein